MLFADFPIANRCKTWYIKGKWFGFGLLYCTKSSTLWGAALSVLHGFYGAVKERIRTARAPRFASRGAFLGRGLANPFGHTKKLIAMYFCNAIFVLILCQNSFSNISSAASVYCPFDSRSFLSRFMVVRIKQIYSVEKVAFLLAGRESIFSISFPTSCVLCPSALSR